MFRTVNWFSIILPAAALQLKDGTFIIIRSSPYNYRPKLTFFRLLKTSHKMEILGRNLKKQYHVLINLVSFHCCVIVAIDLVTQILVDIDP